LKISLGKNPSTGKYESYFETFPSSNATEARKRLRELLTQLDKGVFIRPSKVTLAEYSRQWLRDYAKPNCAARTFDRCEEIVKLHLIPNLGFFELKALHPDAIQKYYASALLEGRLDGKGGLSASTVLKHHRIRFEILRYGVKHGVLMRNVCELVDSPKTRFKEMKIWGPEEISRFLNFVKL
jgi:integrase